MAHSEIRRPNDFEACAGCPQFTDVVSIALRQAEAQGEDVAFGKGECKKIEGRLRTVEITVDFYTPAGEGIEILPLPTDLRNIRLCPGRVDLADSGRTDMSRMLI
jgi:hypothetical protein